RKTPIQWLKKNLPNNMSAGDTVAITGHSLGGAISPVLAQALKDYQEAWNTNGISLNIAAYLFAGHTPGDTVYRDYVQSSLSKIESTVNLYDVVPHAWSLCPTSSPVCLEKIRSLYESVMPEIVNKEDATVSTMCDWAIDKSKKATLDGSTASVNYSRWTNEIKLEGDLEKANPQVVEKLLSGLRFLKTVSHVKASLAVICDTNDENQIDNCLEYFSCFMVIMGGQHVAQYRIKVFKDDAFSNDLKAIFDLSKEFDELYGGIVLSKLFSLLANWKKAVTQNKGSR
ncbi:MAG TPA: hypothetical protein ENK77_03355, partial [Epsilonproteobacteria bacterium]|nr:hypothetical protein [Campylobacterota bacterium]